jgi:hypothetical protein
MPLLTENVDTREEIGWPEASASAPVRKISGKRSGSFDSWPPKSALFATCANPGCQTGWLHLWRSRTRPIFEEAWTCSAECTEAQMASAVARELRDGGTERAGHRPRIPIGLVLMEEGWITHAQLHAALEAQKRAGTGRLGQWLIEQRAADEATITRALGLQWSCPVLSIERHDRLSMAAMLPRLFVDAYGALPLRAAGRSVLYLAFEERPDPILALALRKMTGLRVENGIVQESLFRQAHARMLDTEFPSVTLIEAVSARAAAHSLACAVERSRPASARLVRLRDFLWLRMSLRLQQGPIPAAADVEDVICTLGWV